MFNPEWFEDPEEDRDTDVYRRVKLRRSNRFDNFSCKENEIAISISCLFLCLENLRMVASALARDVLVQLHHLLPVMMG